MTKQDLVKTVDEYLKPNGFVRKDKAWYLDSKDTVVLFAIDKSQYSELYYASVHFLLKALSNEKYPKFWKANSYLRAEKFMKDDPKEYLDLENDMDDDTRKIKIKQLIENSLSLLKLFETEEGIKHALTLYNPRAFGIDMDAQKSLGITID